MKVDIALRLVDKKYYDISFTKGDFTLTNGLDTALLMSVFGEKRADVSEVPTPELQRGWWGNLFNDVLNYEYGSKLWLLDQARATQEKINDGVAYLQEGLNWLKEDNYVDQIFVDGDSLKNGVNFSIKLFRSQSIIGNYVAELWQGTLSDVT
jgi:phage gp46-like protein